MDTKAKYHLKKIDLQLGYRLVIQSVMLVFLTQLCELLPLSLLSGSTLPSLHFPVWISLLYTRILCVRGGGYGVLGLRQQTPASKSLYRSVFYMTTFYIAFYESYLSAVYYIKFLYLLRRYSLRPFLYSTQESTLWLTDEQTNSLQSGNYFM